MDKVKATEKPVVWFSPLAWCKLQVACRVSGTLEVGCFGITPNDDNLHVEDVFFPKQSVTEATVKFDDESVADWFSALVEADIQPRQLTRVWLHRHPKMGLTPSSVDDATFDEIIGAQDVGVMVIFDTNKAAAWVQFNGSIGGLYVPVRVKCDVAVDYDSDIPAFDAAAFASEVKAAIVEEKPPYQYRQDWKKKDPDLLDDEDWRQAYGYHCQSTQASDDAITGEYCDNCGIGLSRAELENETLAVCQICGMWIGRCEVCYNKGFTVCDECQKQLENQQNEKGNDDAKKA